MRHFYWIPAVLAFFPFSISGQTYTVGDVVEDYTLTDFNTGESVSLYELGAEGGVLVLEWFAYWCPFCASAAANVEEGIVQYYNGVSAQGLPVRHIAINVQGGAEAQGMQFAEFYGFTTVLEDFDRDFFSRFNAGGGQPLFVVLNAEPNTGSAQRWEVLYERLNYASNEAPDISALMRPVIDSVAPGEGDSIRTLFPEVEGPEDGVYTLGWLGRFYDVSFPWIYEEELGFLYLTGEGADSLFVYHLELDWIYTNSTIFPHLYHYESGHWLWYLRGSGGLWFYDYVEEGWRMQESLTSQ